MLVYCYQCDKVIEVPPGNVSPIYDIQLVGIRFASSFVEKNETNPPIWKRFVNGTDDTSNYIFVYEAIRCWLCESCFKEWKFDKWLKGDEYANYGYTGYTLQ